MFRMVNKHGNAYMNVASEREKKRLESLGYTVVSATVAETEEINIDRMTASQLEEFAKKNNIDLSKCENKAERLETIKNSINK